jgi:hypothetical protein
VADQITRTESKLTPNDCICPLALNCLLVGRYDNLQERDANGETALCYRRMHREGEFSFDFDQIDRADGDELRGPHAMFGAGYTKRKCHVR